jgi:DNA (cytosine-5)-methyltransferase 1
MLLTSVKSKEKYSEVKARLINKLTDVHFPDSLNDEAEAVVTHWLQNPTEVIPLLTEPIKELFYSTFISESATNNSDHLGINDPFSTYQFKLPIEWDNIPFPPLEDAKFTFIDLFAGIGGFRLAMQKHGGRCVFSSEWDANSQKTYERNFGETPFGDIQNIAEDSIPNHDILCAGFPCQPFSLAGVSARNSLNTAHGFACETQGTLFFDIARILEAKRPKVAFLENVRNLIGHDKGNTFSVIQETIESLGYSFQFKLINSSPLVPQKRIRCYMVCVRNDLEDTFSFPSIEGPALPLKSILETNVNESFTISTKLWEGHQRRTTRNLARGTGFTAFCADINKPSNTIVARYGKDGKECLIPQDGKNPRMLTPRECARLQGFPEEFVIPVAKTTAYRQFGNSVAVPIIERITEEIVQVL